MPARGDIAAHSALLPLIGEPFTWSLFGGMPLWLYYFPGAFWAAETLSWLIGDGYALRVVALGGGPAVIWASYVFLRAVPLPRLYAGAGAAAAGLLFLAESPGQEHAAITAWSAAQGQFSFQYALALSLLCLAALCAPASSSRRELGLGGLAGLAAAGALLCHIYALPLLAAGGVTAVFVRRTRGRLWALPAGVLAAGWMLFPMADALKWSASGGHPQLGWQALFPWWVLAVLPLAAAGMMVVWRSGRPRWLFLSPLLTGAPLFAAGATIGDAPQLWNGRVLPYVFLPICWAAGIGVAAAAMRAAAKTRFDVRLILLASLGLGAVFLIGLAAREPQTVERPELWWDLEDDLTAPALTAARAAGGGDLHIYYGSGLLGEAFRAAADEPGLRLTWGAYQQAGGRPAFAWAAGDVLRTLQPGPPEAALTAPMRLAGRQSAWLGGDLTAIPAGVSRAVTAEWEKGIWDNQPLRLETLRANRVTTWIETPPPPASGTLTPHPPSRFADNILGGASGWSEAAIRWWRSGAHPDRVPARSEHVKGPFVFVDALPGWRNGNPTLTTEKVDTGYVMLPFAWYPGWKVVSGGTEGTWAAGPANIVTHAHGGQPLVLEWTRGWQWTAPLAWGTAAALAAAAVWGFLPDRGAQTKPKKEAL